MIKKAGLIILSVCLLLVSLSPVGLVQASSGLTLLSSSAEVDFPARLKFSISAESDVNITDIRLHYRVERADFAKVTSEVYIEFMPATAVQAEWTWDMRRTGGLPPGSIVDYWWTLRDAKDSEVETEPLRVQIDDTRYSWQSLTQGKITMYWYAGDEIFAGKLMAAAQQTLSRLAEDTGAAPEKPVGLYIYANSQDLQGSMIFPQEWTGGVAFTRYGVIAMGISPDNFDWGERVIAHELTHLVIHQITFNPYGGLPTWLNEGLSMYAERTLPAELGTLLNNAVAGGILISVRGLSSPFSVHVGESALSYVQSYSLVKFLIDSYGQEKMFELLGTFKMGSGYDEALVKTYGFDMDGMDAQWRAYIGADVPQVLPEEPGGVHPALILLAILIVLAAGIIVFWLARKKSAA